MVMASVSDVLAYYSSAKRCLKTALDMMAKMNVKDMPDSFEMPSLVAIYVKTGDVMYVPCGFISVEKCISDTSIAVRTVLRVAGRSVNQPFCNLIVAFSLVNLHVFLLTDQFLCCSTVCVHYIDYITSSYIGAV